jgi:DNA-binding ferritin-like protein (Dps family)
MWCTIKDCNTAFDWQTGKIINGPLHNPHYHEFIRLNGPLQIQEQNPELACLTPIQIMSNQRVAFIYDAYRTVFLKASTYSMERLASEYLRAMTEIFDYFQEPEAYGPRTYEKLRMEYLQGLISKKRWASKMSHRETIRTKRTRIFNLRNMYKNASADIFSILYNESIVKMNPSVSLLQHFVDSHETLRAYYEQEMKNILADFSDTTAKVLIKDNNRLLWQYVNIK